MRALLTAIAMLAAGCLDFDALSRGASDGGRDLADASAGADLAGADFAGADFAGADFASGDLAVGDLAGADFAGVDFATPPDLGPVDFASAPDLVVLGATCGTASTCGGFGGAFCDDFDGANPLQPWVTQSIFAAGTGSIAVDGTHACRGADALHLQTQGNTNVVSTLTSNIAVSGTTYARAYVYFAAAPTTTQVFRVWTSTNSTIGFEVASGHWASTWNNNAVATSGPAVPSGAWSCLEIGVAPGSPGTLSFWVNDVPQPSLGFTQPTVAAAQRIEAALVTPSAGMQDANLDVWIDEVALDTAYIPCAR